MVFAMIAFHVRPRLRSLVVAYSTKAVRPSNSFSPDSASELIRILNHRGDYTRAFQIFDNLVKQRKKISTVSLLALIETCSKANQIERGRQIETLIDQSIEWKNHLRLQTSLINMYMKCQQIDQGKPRTKQSSSTDFRVAERIFERIRHLPECDVVVYNAMLVWLLSSAHVTMLILFQKGYLRNHRAERCFQCADQMRHAQLSPDNVTFILLLNGRRLHSISNELQSLSLSFTAACTVLRDVKRGMAIHEELRLSSLDDVHVHLYNALIDFFGKVNEIRLAETIFDQMNLRETSTYNTLMKAYLVNRMPVNVLELFDQMKGERSQSVGPIGFTPDLITFMAVSDACEALGLLNSPESTYGKFSWKNIFSRIPSTIAR